MKQNALALLALAWAGSAVLHGQTVDGFDDIKLWTGSGTNRAALVLQWNDGGTPTSLVWGFRWNGSATGFDMLVAIAGTSTVRDTAGDPVETLKGVDPRLVLGITRYSFGDALESITFQTPAVNRGQQDWASGYWEYFISGGQFEYFDWLTNQLATYSVPGTSVYSGVSWTSSPVGASDRPLVDGAWDALSFAPNFASQSVQQPVPVGLPVPAVAVHYAGSRPGVAFGSVGGLSYQFQFKENPASGVWTDLGPKVPGTGQVMQFHDLTNPLPVQRFYRVSVSQ